LTELLPCRASPLRRGTSDIEYRSEKAVEELHSTIRHTAVTTRDGRVSAVDVTELVPGDVVGLDVGDVIPADIRSPLVWVADGSE
jgi:magnesium-transporting ATPase (P-type)